VSPAFRISYNICLINYLFTGLDLQI